MSLLSWCSNLIAHVQLAFGPQCAHNVPTTSGGVPVNVHMYSIYSAYCICCACVCDGTVMCLAAGAIKDSIVGEERLVRHLLLELAHQPHYTGAFCSNLLAVTLLTGLTYMLLSTKHVWDCVHIKTCIEMTSCSCEMLQPPCSLKEIGCC